MKEIELPVNSSNPTRRDFLQTVGLVTTVALVPELTACGTLPDSQAADRKSDRALTEQIRAQGVTLTSQDVNNPNAKKVIPAGTFPDAEISRVYEHNRERGWRKSPFSLSLPDDFYHETKGGRMGTIYGGQRNPVIVVPGNPHTDAVEPERAIYLPDFSSEKRVFAVLTKEVPGTTVWLTSEKDEEGDQSFSLRIRMEADHKDVWLLLATEK